MRVVVTGGGGFVGRRLTQLLAQRGDEVIAVGRHRYPDMEAWGARTVAADVRDFDKMKEILRHGDAVFHLAAKVGYWGRKSDFRSINVDGTKSVLRAAVKRGVTKLIFASTPSVVGYSEDVEGAGEELPYAAHHQSDYAETKAEAERIVLAHNGETIATVALRPHLVVGTNDHAMMPRIVARCRTGRLVRVGDGTNRVDVTHVDNAAWAFIDALSALTGPDADCAGRPFFISNDEPVLLWEWLGCILERLGIPPIRRAIPSSVAQTAGASLEALWRALPLPGEPPLTRFLANALSKSHWYDLRAAKRDLHYRARIGMQEATDDTVQWLRYVESGANHCA